MTLLDLINGLEDAARLTQEREHSTFIPSVGTYDCAMPTRRTAEVRIVDAIESLGKKK